MKKAAWLHDTVFRMVRDLTHKKPSDREISFMWVECLKSVLRQEASCRSRASYGNSRDLLCSKETMFVMRTLADRFHRRNEKE